MNTRVWAAVSLVAIASAVLTAAILVGTDSATLGQITVILAMVATAVPALIGAQKTQEVQNDIRNGVLRGKVQDAVRELVQKGELETPIRRAVESIAQDDTTALSIEHKERREDGNG
jgi:hypothetical protein